jgi:hypothetical protein
VTWIWSDELAAAAEAEGFDHTELASWRVRPVAFSLQSNQPASALVRQLLGLAEGGTPEDLASETPAGDLQSEPPASAATCTCGAAIRSPVLAAEAAVG